MKRKTTVAKEINLLGAALSRSSGGDVAISTSCASQVESVADPKGTDVGDDDSDADAEASASDDDQAPAGGFMSLIKAFVPAEKQPAAPKAKAQAKARTSPTTTQVTRPPRTAQKPKSTAKVSIGNATKRRKTQQEDLSTQVMDAGVTGDMSEADIELVNDFKHRLSEMKKLDPPLADGPFKSYLTDLCSGVVSLKNEMKTKRRSALRRQDKENDPLYLSLGEVQSDADLHIHLLKCLLTKLDKT